MISAPNQAPVAGPAFPSKILLAFLDPFANLLEPDNDKDKDAAAIRAALGNRFAGSQTEAELKEIVEKVTVTRFLSDVERILGKDRGTFLSVKRNIDSLTFRIAMSSATLSSQVNALTILKTTLGLSKICKISYCKNDCFIGGAYEIKRECKESAEAATREIRGLRLLELVIKEKSQAELLLQIEEIVRFLVLAREFDEKDLHLLWETVIRKLEEMV